jgi:hypothetical protein
MRGLDGILGVGVITVMTMARKRELSEWRLCGTSWAQACGELRRAQHLVVQEERFRLLLRANSSNSSPRARTKPKHLPRSPPYLSFKLALRSGRVSHHSTKAVPREPAVG